MKHTKRLHQINTVMHYEGDTTMIGRDEMGNSFTLNIPTLELLEWLDEESRKQMVKVEIKRIKKLAI